MAEMRAVDVSALRVGIPRAMFCEQLDVEIEAAVSTAAESLGEMTRGSRDVKLPAGNNLPLLSAEAYKYHAQWIEKSPELYKPETLRRIRQGAAMSAADYERGVRDLAELRGAADKIFSDADVDVLVTPTVAVQAPTVAELVEHPEELRKREMAMLRNTRPFNTLGLPTISVPCGFTKDGMPIGLQISGRAGAEAVVMGIGNLVICNL